ncbi:hypothetical protein ACS0TY_030118 [Phlomoides rotata]
MKTLPTYGVSLFAMLAWNLWKARNRRYFDRVVQIPDQIVSWAIDAAAEIQPTRRKRNGVGAPGSLLGKWSPPPHGKLKLNSDAGVFSDGSVGLGFIVRNSSGKMILAGTRRCLVTVDNSTMIEALALRFGVSTALNHGLYIDQLESDSNNLVRAITNGLEVDVLSSLIIDDIADLVSNLNVHEFSFIGRDANRVAHFLSHYGPFVGFDTVWDTVPPVNCIGLLEEDVRREPIDLG